LLAIANLIVAWRFTGPARAWWLTAAVLSAGDRLFTFSYFIPTMIRLMRAPDSTESVGKAVRWANLDYVRLAIVLAAWLTALNAFSLLHRSHV
jgi:hypothetical protein